MKQERLNKEKYRIYVITLKYQIVNEKNQIKKAKIYRENFFTLKKLCVIINSNELFTKTGCGRRKIWIKIQRKIFKKITNDINKM